MQSTRTTREAEQPAEAGPVVPIPAVLPSAPQIRYVQSTEDGLRDTINSLVDFLSGRGVVPDNLATAIRWLRPGDFSETPDINAFINGIKGQLELHFDPDNEVQRMRVERIIEVITGLAQEYARQMEVLSPPSVRVGEALQPLTVAPTDASPFSFVIEGDTFRITNNRYLPFTGEDRESIKHILEAAVGMDSGGMGRVLELVDRMAEVAAKANIFDTRSRQRAGIGEVSQALAGVRDAYQKLLGKLVEEGEALTGLAAGDPDALGRESLGIAREAERARVACMDRISRFYSGSGVSSLIRDVEEVISNPTYAGDLVFSDFEISVFNYYKQRFAEILPRMDVLSRRLAELDMVPSLDSQQLTPAEAQVFANFLEFAGAFELFRAKARFMTIYNELLEEQNRGSFVEGIAGPRAYREPLSGRQMENLLLAMEPVMGPALPLGSREQYEELLELRGPLELYGQVMENAVVQSVAEALTASAVPEAERINYEDLTEQGRAVLSNLRVHREALARSHDAVGLGSVLYRYANYLRMFDVDTSAYFERSETRMDEALVSAALERGDIPDLLYESSRYFLKYHGTEFLVAVTVLSAGAGGIAGGIRAGVQGLLEVGSAAARGGYAAATAVAAVPAAVVAGHALYDFARGEWGGRAYQDLDIASAFLLMASMGWAGGTGLGARFFSAGTAGLGSTAIGAHLVESISQGRIYDALSDTVAIAVGSTLFVKSLSGIRQYRLAGEAMPASTARVSGPFGLVDVQLPHLWRELAFPYTATGAVTMFAGAAAFTAAFSPDTIAQLIESQGIGEYLAMLNSMCADLANEGPVFMLGFRALGTGVRAVREWRLASGERGFRSSVRTVIRNMALGETGGSFVEIPLGTAEETMAALIMPSSNPGRTFAALQAGAGSTAIDIATRYGADLTNQEFFHRLMVAALGDTRMTASGLVDFLGELRLPRGFRRQLRQFAEEFVTANNQQWQAAEALLSGQPLSTLQQRLFIDANQLAQRQLSEARIAAGAAGLPLVVGGWGAVRVASAVPEADAILELNRFLQQLESDPASAYFFNMLVPGGPEAGFPGVDRRFTTADIRSALDDIAMFFQSIEDGSSRSSAMVKAILPDEFNRFCFVYACALSLLSSSDQDISGLDILVEDAINFLVEGMSLGLDFSAMKPSDYFLAANMVRRAPAGQPISDAGLVSGFLAGDPAFSDPQFARVLLAALYYKGEMRDPSDQQWVLDASYYTYFNLVDTLTGSSEQIERIHGEMMVSMFDNPEFYSAESMRALDRQALILLWRNTWDRYPANIYAPPSSGTGF
ncbi:MAG: hypothetical protein AB1657_02635 [Candidatus Micrarchaeota archaeon]